MDTADTYIHINETTRFSALDEETKNLYRSSTFTLVYMSMCLTCTIWQLFQAGLLAWRVRKWLHFAVLFETILSFQVILCSVLNSMVDVTCSLVGHPYYMSINISYSFYLLYCTNVEILGIHYLS
jgi:hypothetical protein